MTTLPLVKTGTIFGFIKYSVTAIASLNLLATLDGAKLSTDFSVTDVRPAYLSRFIRPRAESEVAKHKGTREYRFLPFADRNSKLSGAPGWDDVLCSVIPASHLTYRTAVRTIEVEFTPPFPAAISSRASADRYAAELATPRVFSGITARVVAITNHRDFDETLDAPEHNSKLDVGTEFVGSVVITPVGDTRFLASGGDQEREVTATHGWRVNNDFGDITEALGLLPSQSLFVGSDNTPETRDLIAVGGDGGPDFGEVFFLNPLKLPISLTTPFNSGRSHDENRSHE